MTVQLPDPISNSVNGVKVIVLCVTFILLIGLIGWLFWSRSNLEATVAEQKTEISGYKAANQGFKDDVDKANAQLKAINDAAAARAQAAEKAIADAHKAAQSYYTRAAALSAQKGTGNECAAVKKLFHDYFAARAQ